MLTIIPKFLIYFEMRLDDPLNVELALSKGPPRLPHLATQHAVLHQDLDGPYQGWRISGRHEETRARADGVPASWHIGRDHTSAARSGFDEDLRQPLSVGGQYHHM